ncbi:MarR family winged helix-turn-helix transcriptional regulator [Sphingoaurantiacus capsulatus]|uniref:MarR family winged helix-turn-helix transcriptional regulator n=1 Tax=Sphingoaurantiacus capsulatus TaxID=1771310 RepID=A0ABV7X7S6_9SPHN
MSKLDIACACGRIRRASRALTRLYDAALDGAGLTTTQFSILRSLARLDGASVTELAAAMGHERSGLTRLLRPLADAGYVQMGSGVDQRSHGLRITDAGRGAIARALPGWEAMQARVETCLGTEDRAALFDLLERIEAIDAKAAA